MTNELAQLQERYERLKLLYQVGQVIHSTLEPQQALELIVREAVRLTGASSGSVVLLNPTSNLLEIEAAHGLPSDAPALRLRVGQGITGWVARSGKAARVGDVTRDPRYVMVRPEVRSELAVPLEGGGEIHGVINVDSERADAFSETDQQLLEELAVQATGVIRNTWLYEQLRLKARLFEALVRVGHAINSTVDLDDALQVIAREAGQLMQARVCSLLLLDPSREWLDLRASFGAGPAYLHKPRLNLAESLVGIVVRRKKPIQLENVQTSSLYHNLSVAREEGLVSLLSVPLIFGEEAIGALNIYTDQAHAFSNEEIRIVSALAELSAVAIEKARLYERIVDVEEELRRNEKLSALGLLAAEVAHEIRNPLTVMKMLFHSLDLKYPVADPRARDVEVITHKLDDLNRIVERILDFARSPEPQLVPVNVNQLIQDMGLLVRHKLKQQNVELVCRLEPELPSALGDGTQLEQAFLNLTLNAAEAMTDGGRLTITTRSVRLPRSSANPSHVLMEFKDTGQGMSAETRERAFSSLLNTTKETGTGLGLAIVRRVVEFHRGRIRIHSSAGRGTTIRITLPVPPESVPSLQ